MSPLRRLYNIEKILYPERNCDKAIDEFEEALKEIYLNLKENKDARKSNS